VKGCGALQIGVEGTTTTTIATTITHIYVATTSDSN